MGDLEHYLPTNRIKALSEQAGLVRVNIQIPAKRYYRSSLEIVRMAKVYYSEGNLESAFVLYQKYLSLMLEQLPQHPEYGAVDPSLKKTSTSQCKESINKAETIKAKLLKKYEGEYRQKEAEEKEKAAQREAEQQMLEAERRSQEERLERERRERQQAEEEERYRQAQQRLQEQSHVPVPVVSAPVPVVSAPAAAVSAPAAVVSAPAAVSPFALSAPSAPPPSYRDVTNSLPPATTPVVDRSTKPPGVHFTHTDSDKHLNGLKPVNVPIPIPQRFTELARQNTLRNIETCGLLFGKLERGEFHLTHVVIPKQKGAPDSCTMLNEEEIFQFHDEHDLIQLGWIHTHPTQTAFLSSVDLHTHSGYQIMMPEAIAIVVAPKYNDRRAHHIESTYSITSVRSVVALLSPVWSPAILDDPVGRSVLYKQTL
ncbi:STAMBP [Bugula neritina]|uniref:STAMBP n=1 Tax=Bugula neritina TaxID=10212 RepID=A0A7J7J5J9_BUGNE|nr:STAMBP [Bugula neritina]